MYSSDVHWRQMALCAWGSQFLADKNDLEHWYRHGIFWAAQQQFRRSEDKQLIAEDFSSWLIWLKHRGATRLTLHGVESASLSTVAGLNWGDRLILVHFLDSDELWACAQEVPKCEAYFEKECSDQDRPQIRNSGYYAGVIDCYICMGAAQKTLNIAQTDWENSAQVLRAELFAPNSRRAEAWPPSVNNLVIESQADAEWANLSALPESQTYLSPHRLLSLLKNECNRFENDTNCKNEGDLYAFASIKESDQISQWGARLREWLEALQIAAANETRWLDAQTGAGEVPVKAASVTANESQSINTTTAQHSEVKSTRLTKTLLNFLVFAMLTIFIIALAKLIGYFEWVALFIALPWMLYVASKK